MAREVKFPNLDRLVLTAQELSAMLGISRVMLWKMHTAGDFPAPLRIGRRCMWRKETVQRWLEQQDKRAQQEKAHD